MLKGERQKQCLFPSTTSLSATSWGPGTSSYKHPPNFLSSNMGSTNYIQISSSVSPLTLHTENPITCLPACCLWDGLPYLPFPKLPATGDPLPSNKVLSQHKLHKNNHERYRDAEAMALKGSLCPSHSLQAALLPTLKAKFFDSQSYSLALKQGRERPGWSCTGLSLQPNNSF